jgi:uncharacterized protein (TIGR00730 family)
MKMTSVCVYCGSSPGSSPVYLAAAEGLGREIAARGMRLVYGGASVGLMGAVAKAALAVGGQVTGVIPQALSDQEVAFKDLDDLIVVDSMHTRKATMAELADGFIALPGGYGTFDEFFEILTWAQLGLHAKPCGLLNINHYYDHLLAFLDHSVNEMFVHQPHRDMIQSSEEAGDLIQLMEVFDKPPVKKTAWIHAMDQRKE